MRSQPTTFPRAAAPAAASPARQAAPARKAAMTAAAAAQPDVHPDILEVLIDAEELRCRVSEVGRCAGAMAASSRAL